MLIVTLAIVITIHELGHYVAARWCNVHVQEFAFGFGKEIWSVKGKGELKTKWSICALPIGGYVKLFGDVDKDNPIIWDFENDCEKRLTPEELEYAYCTKTVWQRIFIVAAGPLINLVFTLLVFFFLFVLHGELSRTPTINALLEDSPAYEAGIKLGDKLLEMDQKKPRRIEDIHDITRDENPPQEHAYLISRNGQEIPIKFKARYIKYLDTLGVKQEQGQTGMLSWHALEINEKLLSVSGIDVEDDELKTRQLIAENFDKQITIGMRYKHETEANSIGKFFVIVPSHHNQHLFDPTHDKYDKIYFEEPDEYLFVRLSPYEAATRALEKLGKGFTNSYKIIAAAIAGKNDKALIGGVGKISEKTGKAVNNGVYSYISFLALFSFMIAIINLLPIPGLDGGYLVFLFYELLVGKALPQWLQSLLLMFGMIFLLLIMIFANISDFLSFIIDVESR